MLKGRKNMIWIPAALCAAYNIAYIIHCLKFKRFRAAVGMALLAAAGCHFDSTEQTVKYFLIMRNGRAAYVHVT